MSINFICKGCGTKFNNVMQSKTIGYCFICNEFFMQKYIFNLRSKLAECKKEIIDLESDHNKLINQYHNLYNDLCKEIEFHSSARKRLVEKVEVLEKQLAERNNL